jgi:predicted nucleic acid-binding protein
LDLVVDANILVAAAMRSSVTRELLIHDGLCLRLPEAGRREVGKVLTSGPVRKRLGELSIADIRNALSILTSRIRFEPAFLYQRELPRAKSLVAHDEDAPYMALALHHRIGIWTNDKGFHQQSEVSVYSTSQLAKSLLRPSTAPAPHTSPLDVRIMNQRMMSVKPERAPIIAYMSN